MTSGPARVGAAGLVILQIVLLATLVVVPHGQWWPRNALTLAVAAALILIGLIISVGGVLSLGSSLTASPIPKDRAALVTRGPYAAVRNPIYSGLMLVGAGLVVFGASWWHLATWLALVVLLAVKARWEERMLASAHPEFASYARRVGRFVPGVGRWRQSAGNDNVTENNG